MLCDLDPNDSQHVELMEHQEEALLFLGNGKVLWGGVGTGKSITALAYYVRQEAPKPLFVITTAKKRDTLDWQGEAAKFGIGESLDSTLLGVLTVDSWHNIPKYIDVENAFFIFDEQKLVGNGTWVKGFLQIAKNNHWILLSATPGDTWLDYAPLFIANGWYKNISDFKRQHVVYAPYVKFPIVKDYLGIDKLVRLRNKLLVEMPYLKHTNRILNFMDVGYDHEKWRIITKNRWNPYENKPIKDAAELFRLIRRVVNTDPSRLEMVRLLMRIHKRLIIFYNFDYELEILRGLEDEIDVYEWNGHRKNLLPTGDEWVYLVQYNSGAESWNCVTTNAMILYSLTYSYKKYIQAQGRIDRLDTSYIDLYYYILVSGSLIDRKVKAALEQKRNFNERELYK